MSQLNHFERQLDPGRQQNFLRRAYGNESSRIPEQDYREAFLILPYMLLDKADDPSNHPPPNVRRNLYRLYRWMAGDKDIDIAEEESVARRNVHLSRYAVAEYMAKLISPDVFAEAVKSLQNQSGANGQTGNT